MRGLKSPVFCLQIGFSLIEVLVSLVVLSVMVLGALKLNLANLKQLHHSVYLYQQALYSVHDVR